MEWLTQLNGNPIEWLLDPSDPGPRYLALRDLLDLPPDDPELVQARADALAHGPIAQVLAAMQPEGWWARPGPGYNPKYRSTVWSLILLAQLGASAADDPRLAQACAYLLDHALTPAGQFSVSGGPGGTIDCLQGNLGWSLLALGVSDPRLDQAIDWMAASVTGEGVAPAGDHSTSWRYNANKCGPGFACAINDREPCAWGAVKVMLAFSLWPAERRTPLHERAIDQGIEFLLSVDPASGAYPSGNNPKPSRNWWKFGFPLFYITDILQVAEALAGLGRLGDPRAAGALDLVRSKQDELGRWSLEYEYTGKTFADLGEKKQPNKWVTLRALRVLKAAAAQVQEPV